MNIELVEGAEGEEWQFEFIEEVNGKSFNDLVQMLIDLTSLSLEFNVNGIRSRWKKDFVAQILIHAYEWERYNWLKFREVVEQVEWVIHPEHLHEESRYCPWCGGLEPLYWEEGEEISDGVFAGHLETCPRQFVLTLREVANAEAGD